MAQLAHYSDEDPSLIAGACRHGMTYLISTVSLPYLLMVHAGTGIKDDLISRLPLHAMGR